jgi:hypothetical protein
MTFESSTSRLEQELYSLWEFIENGCDARPEDKHDALSTLDRIKLFFSEIQRVGTIGHVHPEVEIGRALATALSGDKQQQFTCPKCGHIGAGPESRLPLCDRCDYRVRMLPSHNGRIFAPRTNAIAKWQEHVTVDDYNRMVDHARELEAELATLAPSHAAPVGPRGDAYKRAYQYLQGRLESIGYYGWAHDMDGEIEDVLTSSATAPIATVINNNQPGWTAIIETEPHVTLDVGTKLYRGPQ